MIVISGICVSKLPAQDSYSIYWEPRRTSPPQESVGDFNFVVQWSQHPVDGFKTIKYSNGADIVVDGSIGPFYVIHPTPQYDHAREYYYKIVAIKKSTPAVTQESCVIFSGDDTDGIIESIKYAEDVLYSMYTGEPVKLLKRRIDNERCPECWNPYQFRRTKTVCNTCLSTGFIDGYYAPITIQIAFDENPKTTDISQTGEMNLTHIKGRMTGSPLVSNRDLIVSMDNNDRFQVVQVGLTKLPNVSSGRGFLSGNAHIISQILTLSEIPPSDDRYKYPVFGKYIVGIGEIAMEGMICWGN
jgi:hypothetical protein